MLAHIMSCLIQSFHNKHSNIEAIELILGDRSWSPQRTHQSDSVFCSELSWRLLYSDFATRPRISTSCPSSVITVRTWPQEHRDKNIGPFNGYIELYKALWKAIHDYKRASNKELATGRQPGGFSEISCGKSHIEIWILKGGVQGEATLPSPCTPPFVIQIFV